MAPFVLADPAGGGLVGIRQPLGDVAGGEVVVAVERLVLLQALGAVTVKGAVYALPANGETREDFAWLAKEIVESGGEALHFCSADCAARFARGERPV